VLNDPWQAALFAPDAAAVTLWAGPFCNLANPLALKTAAELGFSGAVVSAELAADDFISLAGRSPLPLGVVVNGNWPLCIARVVSTGLQLQSPLRSPKGEEAWTVRHGSLYWVYPNWELDLRGQSETLRRAGYRLFVSLIEPLPPTVKRKQRPGLWNWEGGLP
jgi:putative protease